MEMLKLEQEERNRKICEAVRKAEKLPDNYRLYVTTVQFTITKDETPDEIQAEVFVTEGKIDSVKYLLAWDAEKNEFCRPQMIWRKYANYRLMADFGMFNPRYFLRPESVTAFLQKNESEQMIYVTTDHKPSGTEIDELVRADQARLESAERESIRPTGQIDHILFEHGVDGRH